MADVSPSGNYLCDRKYWSQGQKNVSAHHCSNDATFTVAGAETYWSCAQHLAQCVRVVAASGNDSAVVTPA